MLFSMRKIQRRVETEKYLIDRGGSYNPPPCRCATGRTSPKTYVTQRAQPAKVPHIIYIYGYNRKKKKRKKNAEEGSLWE